MKKAAAYLITVTLLFLLCPDKSAAQDIEGELRSYAALCDSCLMLKKSLSEGATISSDKAKAIIGKFVDTGKRLKSRSMSPWQKDLYRKITERFTGTSYEGPFTAEIPHLEALGSGIATIRSASATAGLTGIETRSAGIDSRVEGIDSRPKDIDKRLKNTDSQANKEKLHFSIIASAAFPHPTAGLMLGLQYRGWGGYVKGMSNFTKAQSTYTCLSDSTLPDGSEFWGGGQNRLEIKSLTAGAMLPIIKNLSIYAGAGAGKWSLSWMDVDGDWANVSDISYKGVAAEAGIAANWKSLLFSAGVTTVKFKTIQVNLGVGVRF